MPFYEFDVRLPNFTRHSSDSQVLAAIGEAANLQVSFANCRELREGDAAVLYYRRRGLLSLRTDQIIVAPISPDSLEVVVDVHESRGNTFVPNPLFGNLEGKLWQLFDGDFDRHSIVSLGRNDLIVPQEEHITGVLYVNPDRRRKFPIGIPAKLFHERSYPKAKARNAPRRLQYL